MIVAGIVVVLMLLHLADKYIFGGPGLRQRFENWLGPPDYR